MAEDLIEVVIGAVVALECLIWECVDKMAQEDLIKTTGYSIEYNMVPLYTHIQVITYINC